VNLKQKELFQTMSAIKTSEETGFRQDTALIEELEKRFSPGGIRRRRLRRYQSILWLFWVNALAGAKRLLDFTVSSSLLVLLSPLLMALYLVHRFKGFAVKRSPRLGRWGLVFEEYSFPGGFARRLLALMNVWRGEMSLVGPRPISPGAVSPSERLAWKRFNARPGLLCLWWIRSRTNIAYGTEIGSDVEYVENQSLMGDLGIALRALPAAMYGEGIAIAPDRVDLIGVTVNNLTMDEAIDDIVRKAHGSTASQVCFVNADCANIAWSDQGYSDILRNSDLVLADGIGMKLAGRLLNRNIRQNVNGTDLLPRLCKVLENDSLGIFLLGGKPGVAADVGRWMADHFPRLPLCGDQDGYFAVEEAPQVIARIKDSGAKVLLVALGVPKQEHWIHDHLQQTGVMVSMGVGGLFDFYSGRIPRAPAWVREIGMEWCYRFLQEPRRMWRRYFVGNFVFLTRVVRERLRSADGL
jgi:N-acetylglucosaminyldiphosphoundecaprenol N-acetyl-beta-D-mannosaminyltransferase